MPASDGWFSRADLETLVGPSELRVLISRGRSRIVDRSWIGEVTSRAGFPEPLIVYPRGAARPLIRLWLRADVEQWMDGYLPGWRDMPPAPPDERRD